MEQIRSADIAAFREGGAAMANAMIEQSGLRVGEDRRRGRASGMNPSGRYEILSRHVFDDGWNSLDDLPAVQDRGAGREAAHHHHPQQQPDIPSTARSIPIAAASMAASIASPGRPMPIWACPPGSISNKAVRQARRAELLEKELSKRATSRAPSRSAPIPIPTSRSSGMADHARDPRSADRAPTTRSASSPNRRSSCATSTSCRAWPSADWPRSRCRSPRSTASWRARWSRARRRHRGGWRR
jgi:hypothetical protein